MSEQVVSLGFLLKMSAGRGREGGSEERLRNCRRDEIGEVVAGFAGGARFCRLRWPHPNRIGGKTLRAAAAASSGVLPDALNSLNQGGHFIWKKRLFLSRLDFNRKIACTFW